MTQKKVEKVWGTEEWIVNNERYCGKILNLNKGFRCSIHHHKEKHETFHILSGRILLELNNTKKLMTAGETQTIKQNEKHRFTGLEDSKIIEFSTTHKEEDSYRDSKSEPINLDKLKECLK
jgi:quercetin dioxygenase-like cupin family protein